MKTKKTHRSVLRRFIHNWAAPVGCGFFFLFLLKFVIFIGYVPTASMEPTIKEGSFILGVRVFKTLERGDVVVFAQENQLLVKRIAGVRGDIVYTATGEALTVPEGCYYMLGDNQEESNDSRYWDTPFVPKARIIAKLYQVHFGYRATV